MNSDDQLAAATARVLELQRELEAAKGAQAIAEAGRAAAERDAQAAREAKAESEATLGTALAQAQSATHEAQAATTQTAAALATAQASEAAALARASALDAKFAAMYGEPTADEGITHRQVYVTSDGAIHSDLGTARLHAIAVDLGIPESRVPEVVARSGTIIERLRRAGGTSP